MDLELSEAWSKAESELVKMPMKEVSVDELVVIKPAYGIPLDRKAF